MPTDVIIEYNRFYTGNIRYGLINYKTAIMNDIIRYNRFECVTTDVISIGSSYSGKHNGLQVHHNAFDSCSKSILQKLQTSTTGELLNLEFHDNIVLNASSGDRDFFVFDDESIGGTESSPMGEVWNNAVFDIVDLIDPEKDNNHTNYPSFWNYNAYESTEIRDTAENQNGLPATNWQGNALILESHGITRTGAAGNRFYTIEDNNRLIGSGRYCDTIGGFSYNISEATYLWEMEAANIVLDDQGNRNLTNNGSITTGGTEPDPPGYGSVGADLNDSTPQYFSVTNANIGNTICNGTDTDCTIIIAFTPDDLGHDYLFSIYQALTGERQYAVTINSGTPVFLWGYDSGDSYQAIYIPHTFSAGDDIIMGLSLDTSAKTYTFLAQDVSTGTYYSITESTTALQGTYNVGTSPLTIGARSDGGTTRAFDGRIWWVRAYDTALSRAQMEAIFENTTPFDR